MSSGLQTSYDRRRYDGDRSERSRERDFFRGRDSPEYHRSRDSMHNHRRPPMERESHTADPRANLPPGSFPSDGMDLDNASTPSSICRSTKTQVDPDFKHFLDLMSERQFWWLSRDKSKKTLDHWEAKAKNDSFRSEFASVQQLASSSKATALRDIAKFNDRIEAVDKKAKHALVSVVESAERHRTSEQPERPLQHKDSLEKRIAELEARLSKIEGSTVSGSAPQIASHYDLEIEELKNRLFEENKRNLALEDQVKALAEKLDSVCSQDVQTNDALSTTRDTAIPKEQPHEEVSQEIQAKIESHQQQISDLFAQLGNETQTKVTQDDLNKMKAEITADIEKAVAENKPSDTEPAMAEALATLKTELPSYHDLDQALARIAELRLEVDHHVEAMKGRIDHVDYPTEKSQTKDENNTQIIENLKKQISDSKQSVEQSVSEQLKKVAKDIGERVTKAVERFIEIVQLETEERKTIAGRTSNIETNVVSLGKELNDIREALISKVAAMSSRLDEQISAINQKAALQEALLRQTRTEVKSMTDELRMQIHCVNAWQSQFTTKDLYKDIVHHISETIPSGVTKQLRTVQARLDALEGPPNNAEQAMKKRKSYNGTPTKVQGPM